MKIEYENLREVNKLYFSLYTTLSLPISAFHTKDNISKVVEVLNRF
jgi:hypothetical protein